MYGRSYVWKTYRPLTMHLHKIQWLVKNIQLQIPGFSRPKSFSSSSEADEKNVENLQKNFRTFTLSSKCGNPAECSGRKRILISITFQQDSPARENKICIAATTAAYENMERMHEKRTCLQGDHSTETLKFPDISPTMRGTHAHVKWYSQHACTTSDNVNIRYQVHNYFIMITNDEIINWMLLKTHVNANIRLVMSSFGTPFHDKRFFPDMFQIFPWNFPVFPDKWSPCFSAQIS